MVSQGVFSISDRSRYNFKSYPFISLVDDPVGAFSCIPDNILHVEDICGYIHYKMESIGDADIYKDLEKICKNDLSLKPEYARLERLNLVKKMFYTDFENEEWVRIVLSRVHDDLLWLKESFVCIDDDLIHKVTGFPNKGSNLVNTRHARKLVEAKLNSYFNGQNMKVNTIQDKSVRVTNNILGYKFNNSSRVDSTPSIFIHTTYVTVNGEEVNLCEIVCTQLLDNITKMRTSRRTIFRFGSLLMHIFFYAARRFRGISHWDVDECTM